jgi:thioredoxin 1
MDDELNRLREIRMKELIESRTQPPRAEVLIATGPTIDALIRTHPLLVVDCWAPWCGPCRRVGPVVESLAGEYAGRIVFAKLNTDEHQQVAQRYGISAIPTLLLFKGGSLAGQITGAYPIDMMRIEILRRFGITG